MKLKWIISFVFLIAVIFSGCENQETSYRESDKIATEQSEMDSGDDESIMEKESEVQSDHLGEGAPIPIEIDLNEGNTYQVQDIIEIGIEQDILYELTIDDVAYTEKRDEFAEDPGNVILVTYTYKNLSDEAVFIDDMSFQMMTDEDGTALDTYYLSDIQIPEPIQKDGSCTAQLAFSSDEKVDSVVLVYHDIINTEIIPVKIAIDHLQ